MIIINNAFEGFDTYLNKQQIQLQKDKALTTKKVYIIYAAVLCLITFVIIIIYIMIKNITKSLKLIAIFAKSDQGDLTKRLDVLTSDELGGISKLINTLIENIHSTLKTVVDTSKKSSGISKELTAVSTEIRTQISDELDDLENIVNTLQNNESKLDTSNRAMDSTKINMMQTQEQVIVLNKEIQQITAQIEDGVNESIEISSQLSELNQQTDKVKDILSIISDIAEQTNLLALNAAIEAARAGEHGRGFAIVSDEIRKLAERTQESITQIDVTISSVTKSITTTSHSMEKFSKHNSKVSESMTGIQDVMQNTSMLMGDNMDLINENSLLNSQIVTDGKSVIESVGKIHEDSRSSYDILNRVTHSVDDLKKNTVQLKNELRNFTV